MELKAGWILGVVDWLGLGGGIAHRCGQCGGFGARNWLFVVQDHAGVEDDTYMAPGPGEAGKSGDSLFYLRGLWEGAVFGPVGGKGIGELFGV